jgi:hypothetical protein
MRVKQAVITGFAILTLGVMDAVAQVAPGREVEVERSRARVADAMAKGDVATAQKLMAGPIPSRGTAAALAGITTYEEIRSCGFYPEETRLQCIIEIKQSGGYGGPLASAGSFEFVSFYVDFNSDGFQPWDYVGSGIVHVTDGSAKTNLAVYRDFNPPGGPRTSNGGASTTTVTNGPILKARAILRWGFPVCDPNAIPFFGNVFDFQIRMAPIR